MPPSAFRLSRLPVVPVPTRLTVDNPTVPQVEKAFKRIATRGDPLATQDGRVFPPFTYTHVQVKRVNDAKNHFQGVQRLRKGRYLAITGGFGTGSRKQAHLFVLRMSSVSASGRWGPNTVLTGLPTDKDVVAAAYGLGKTQWHAGGFSAVGDVLVVPLESGRNSSVAFLLARDPEALERLDVEIQRAKIGKAGAAALTRLPDGRFVCAVWREVGGKPKGRIDFYLSCDATLGGGFDETHPVTWQFTGLSGGDKRDPSYQNINFVWQKDGTGARQLYLIGTENGSKAAPAVNGPNYADLFRVTISSAMLGPQPVGAPELEHVDTIVCRGLRDYCNFAAGAGAYVDETGCLSLYACGHHRVEREVRITEFGAAPAGRVATVQQGWIELYEHDHFGGKKLAIYGKRNATIRDYRAIYVGGGDFDECVSSVRYQLPQGCTYRLYRDPGFPEDGGDDKRLDLNGTGEVVEIPDFKRIANGFGDQVSSSRYV